MRLWLVCCLGPVGIAMLVFACGNGSQRGAPPGPDSGAVVTKFTPIAPPDGPCDNDAECMVILESCECGCYPMALGVQREFSSAHEKTACGGNAPRNCGAVSPCSNLKAVCDKSTKRCQIRK